ncbi:fasciclin domain-containing protein [Mangrovibacterium lignilyticum]|uniref:fasciclin domain-containing protein n=1 Tax=Mangrovibacterium lignilyticum TaxID=2668052 RepID=UPI0013D78225|nr:fasciclin domain-containing protein [Mangrovibacterium lignilyticum]
MKKTKSLTKILSVLMLVLVLFSCENEMDKHYAAPDWLKGSAWEVLEGRGNYSIFLEGADLAGFRPILEGKSLVTVMAPDDEAFAAYLSQEGKTSIADFTEGELQKLIGFHLMYYSYSQDKLVNFRPADGDGATEEETDFAAGLYYKHRTRSYEAPTMEQDTDGVDVLVYHNEAMLPVFSYRMFDTKNIDATYNYEYFYSNSTWTGSQGFNVSNASVSEYEIIASNGYLYLVNQVVEPLNTIHTELENRPEYSTYLELYDSYEYYELDDQLTTDFGNGTDLYRHLHEYPLANIAAEWPVSNYRAIQANSGLAYSTFAPSNAAFDAFMTDYWIPGGYSSLSDVNSIAIRYLIQNSYYADAIVFPEEITNGEVINSFDAVINFDVNAVPAENRVVCQNGVFYGLEELVPPGMYSSVTGPAFRYKNLSWYLYMLDPTDLLVSLSSNEANFTMLIPDTTQMLNGGMGLEGEELWSSDDGDYAAMSTSAMIQTVNLHTVTGNQAISTSGTQVLRTNIPYTYWYVKDGEITTSVLYNEYFENPSASVDFYGLTKTNYNGSDWTNGKAYTYASPEIFRPLLSTSSMQYRLAITQDATYDYYQFSKLLRDAGAVNSADGTINFLNGVRCVAFVPTNDAIVTAIAAGKIPGVETDGTVSNQGLLKSYLACYFVPTEDNGMTTYPYVGSGVNGEYGTSLLTSDGTSIFNAPLNIIDDGSSLSVQLGMDLFEKGETPVVDVIPDFDYFPFSYGDGGVHYIDGVL